MYRVLVAHGTDRSGITQVGFAHAQCQQRRIIYKRRSFLPQVIEYSRASSPPKENAIGNISFRRYIGCGLHTANHLRNRSAIPKKILPLSHSLAIQILILPSSSDSFYFNLVSISLYLFM